MSNELVEANSHQEATATGQFTPKRAAALESLLLGRTVAAVAQSVGVDRRTTLGDPRSCEFCNTFATRGVACLSTNVHRKGFAARALRRRLHCATAARKCERVAKRARAAVFNLIPKWYSVWLFPLHANYLEKSPKRRRGVAPTLNTSKLFLQLLCPLRGIQLVCRWRGSELDSRFARHESEVVGRLDKEQLGSAGRPVEE